MDTGLASASGAPSRWQGTGSLIGRSSPSFTPGQRYDSMKVTDLDFTLPESLIALRPVHPRDTCRLLVLGRDGLMEHTIFSHLPEFLRKGDLLLLNDTKVFPARLTGIKKTGGKIE